MARSRAKAVTSIDAAGWTRAVTRLLAGFDEGREARSTSPVVEAFGEAPTVVLVGPTGSGKSAVLNAMLGQSLLPEGTDHTTPVPTVIRRGEEFSVRALGPRGGVLRKPLPLGANGAGSSPLTAWPEGQDAMLERLQREDDDDIVDRWERFWGPAFEAAREGRCVCLEVVAPLEWLPEGVRIVDIPGYEGWFPEEHSDLHTLVTSWLDQADHAVFVMEMSKVVLGNAVEFLRRQRERDRGVSLLVNQLDRFDSQGAPLGQAFDAFEERIRDSLEDQGVPGVESLPLFLGAGRIPARRRLAREHEERLLGACGDFLDHTLRGIEGAAAEFSRRQALAQESRRKRVDTHLRRCRKEVAQAFRQALDDARQTFLEPERQAALHRSLENAIDRVEISVRDMGNAVIKRRKSRLVRSFQREIERTVKRSMKTTLDRAMRRYQDSLRGSIERSVEDYVTRVGAVTGGVSQMRTRLQDQVALVADSVTGSVAAMVAAVALLVVGNAILFDTTVILGFVLASSITPWGLALLIVGAVLASAGVTAALSPRYRLRKKLKKKLVPLFGEEFFLKAWERVAEDRRADFDRLWSGRQPDGGPVKGPDGKEFPGLESILRESAMQMARD